MNLFEVRGKSTRGLCKVFILLTKEITENVQYLVNFFPCHGVHTEYVVSRRSGTSPLDGCTAMWDITAPCPDFQNPDAIRSTKLCRYLATTTQVSSLSCQ